MPTAPAPNHRDLYLLIAGLILGILLGPGIFGRVAPDAYRDAFVGDRAARGELAAHEVRRAAERSTLMDGRPALADIEAFDRATHDQRLALEADAQWQRRAHDQLMRGRLDAFILALAVIMIVETLIDPTRGPTPARLRQRLPTVRYALLALWLALMLARPAWLASVPAAFGVLLVVVALAAGLTPLRKNAQA